MRGFFRFMNGVMWFAGIILAFAAGVFVDDKMEKETQAKKLKEEGCTQYFNGAEAALSGKLSVSVVKPGVIHMDTYDESSPAYRVTRLIQQDKNPDIYDKIREKI